MAYSKVCFYLKRLIDDSDGILVRIDLFKFGTTQDFLLSCIARISIEC